VGTNVIQLLNQRNIEVIQDADNVLL